MKACLAGAVVLLGASALTAQKYRSDDPIRRDPDNLSIPKPSILELSPTFDSIENTWGSEGGPPSRATNINTIGEVPDSSWFTNRIGQRPMTAAEVARGGGLTDGPAPGPLVIEEALLLSTTSGIVVRDSRGHRFLLRFDPVGLPSLATGAEVIVSKLLWAAGYNVWPSTIVSVAPEVLEIGPGAVFRQRLSNSEQPLDEEFLRLLFEDSQADVDGSYRASASEVPEGEWVGQFRFYGTRNDDPNDIFAHENRRELRALKVFAAWLNHTYAGAINTVDYYVTENGSSFLRHYLFDFTSALGSGYDLNDRLAFKRRRAGYDYDYWSNFKDSLKTAASLGLWERPWMRIDYREKEFPEVGRIEADYFKPAEWKPEYPNAAFDRMLSDDALWAADILSHFDDDMVRAVVATADFLDPAAANYLSDVLIKRREKLVRYYLGEIDPICHFRVQDQAVLFRNPGIERGMADDAVYQYQWFRLDNATGLLEGLTARRYVDAPRIPIPAVETPYLAVRLRTRSRQQPGWKGLVQVALRRSGPGYQVVGLERETGGLSDELPVVGLPTRALGGTFAALNDEEQELLLDWFNRYQRLTGRRLDPESYYDSLPQSIRTTFEAICHALSSTRLTDEDGQALGDGLSLVARLEAVAGQEPDADSDEQFRLYVVLHDDALEKLQAAIEFERRPDNTVRHAGYPINYRQQGGTPSLQFSISADGQRADIDIDYSEPRFPASLLHGRRSAFDSDVRAGANHERHISRWEGLPVWWEGLFGTGAENDRADLPAETMIPRVPRLADDELEPAVADFLSAWLVERNPAEAVPYFSPQAFSCLPDFADGTDVDYGLAPVLLLDRMHSALAGLPQGGNLQDVSTGVRLTEPGYRLIEHSRHAQFVLFEIPNSAAVRLDCLQNGQISTESGRSTEGADAYGRFFAASLALRGGSMKSGRILLVWQKQGGLWRIVSYQVEGYEGGAERPDLRTGQLAEQDPADGDADFLAANRRLLTSLAEGDVEQALSLFASSAEDCVALYAPAEDRSSADPNEVLRSGLHEIVNAGPDGTLMGLLEPVRISHPDLKPVAHPDQGLVSLAAVPEHIGRASLCRAVARAEPVGPTPATPGYGIYYATAFELKTQGAEPAVFYLLWARSAAGWQIVAYHVVES